MDQSTYINEEIKPYKIHVSSKYLELTKKKLELTRLPHEVLLSKDREWELGTPKGVVEPLIDFWLERYTWRTQEEKLNQLPQYRTAISPSPSANEPALRIHFIHLKSSSPDAIPLLLIPSFPLTNLSLSSSDLFERLVHPKDGEQTFNVVCPSIPGLGFSDAFTSHEGSQLQQTGHMFDTLMQRLGYEYYIASATGSGRESPAGIDYHLIRILGERYRESCLGVHVIDPCVEAPRIARNPVEWLKFNAVKLFQAGIWGYEKADWMALKTSARNAQRNNDTRKRQLQTSNAAGERTPLLKSDGLGYGAMTTLGLREPTTFSYAFCDSPIGLLSLTCSALKRASPEYKMSEMQIIDLTQLAWLPGPEAGMRFWSSAVRELSLSQTTNQARARMKTRMAVTTFNANGVDEENGYVCPAWISSSSCQLVSAQRVEGKIGLAIWERSQVIVDGIQGLAKVVSDIDDRLKLSGLESVVVGTAPEGHDVGGDGVIVEEEESGMQMDVESPDTVVAVDMS